MTARPWGTTGRVTVETPSEDFYVTHVLVDGEIVGAVARPAPPHESKWDTYVPYKWVNQHALNRDDAVMWVLRRTNVDVWRAERGPVWQVRATPTPADPFGPAGWNWWAAPVDPHNPTPPRPPLWDGADTPHRGDRTHIRTQAHALATNAHALATEGTP